MRATRVLLFAVLVAGCVCPAAQAAFPGQNGKIAFSGPAPDGNRDIYVATPGVPGAERLTDAPGIDARPAWSPDGTHIAFQTRRHGSDEIYVMRADGTDETRLTTNPAEDREPAWSFDGTKIAFFRAASGIYVMNADGTGVTLVAPTSGPDGLPAWSPDGTKVAFMDTDPIPGIHLISPDGSGEMNLVQGGTEPDWSADANKIAYSYAYLIDHRDHPCDGQIDQNLFWTPPSTWELNPLFGDPGSTCPDLPVDTEPAWSPDGTKVAWRQYDGDPDTSVIQVGNVSGGIVDTIDDLPFNAQPDWQPVQPGYPRPKGATPFRASLVPAYIACTSPNRTHGPPLAFASCSPPSERSSVLTVGTPDANGVAAKMSGALTLSVLAGNPSTPTDEADVAISISVTDVRCAATNAACPAGAGSDYNGMLLALPVSTRITDRRNTPPGPSGVPGTGNTQFKMPVICAPTADTTVGSTCSLSTTADALMTGVIREGARAVWEMDQVHVRDAGPNGSGYESPACPPTCGDGDETLFLRQGVFVP